MYITSLFRILDQTHLVLILGPIAVIAPPLFFRTAASSLAGIFVDIYYTTHNYALSNIHTCTYVTNLIIDPRVEHEPDIGASCCYGRSNHATITSHKEDNLPSSVD